MIDIHNHILINVDDGPSNLEDMLALLRNAKDEGITGIVATPHHLHVKYENSMDIVIQKIETIKALDEVKNLNIDIFPGQEIRINDQIIKQLDSGEIRGINDSKYLLIELPSNKVPHFTQQLIYEIQMKGYVPIIAHPERNKEIANNLDVLFDLVNSGALSQLTSSSLVGKSGKHIKKISVEIIENNLTHFIASDAHDASLRPFYMESLLKHKKMKNYTDKLKDLINNSEALIKNDKIKVSQPFQNYKDRNKGFWLFRK